MSSVPNQSNSSKKSNLVNINKVRFTVDSREVSQDVVLSEQPLQIRLQYDKSIVRECELADSKDNEEGIDYISRTFAITMRTPGDDELLILGLLKAEGVFCDVKEILSISQEEKSADIYNNSHMWEVTFRAGVTPNLSTIERFQITYSSCGLCGATSLQSLELKNPPILDNTKQWLDIEKVLTMTDTMRKAQPLFERTGASHAAACFDENGNLIVLKEDVGRHNAFDKVVGYLVTKNDKIESNKYIIALSGRISFELVQKAVMAGIAVIVAVGAPSELAVKAAKRFDITLIGFATEKSFNLYHGEWRLRKTR